MAANPLITRLLDAGMQFGEMSQATAEKLVKELVRSGAVRRKEAAHTVQALIDRGRSSTEQMVEVVRSEVERQVARVMDRVDGVEARLDEVVTKLTPRPAEPTQAKKAPAAKKAPVAKKAPAAKQGGSTRAARASAR